MHRSLNSLLIAVLLIATAHAGSEPRVENLIVVTLRGTQIDKVPHHMDIFVAEPQGAARGTREAMLTAREANLATILMSCDGRHFMYRTLVQWPYAQLKHAPKLGDVVYAFRFRNAEAAESFVRKYGLTLITKSSDNQLRLYGADPQYYVVAEIIGTVYKCMMHPQIEKPEPGKCPLCSMDLVKDEP